MLLPQGDIGMGKAKGLAVGLLAVVGWLAASGPAHAADMREFIHDTQQTANQGSQVVLVWWIPPEFWQVSLSNNSAVPAEQAAQIVAAMRDYQVFALVRASTGIQGLTELQSKADLVSNAHLAVGGKAITPIAPEKVPGGVQTMLGALRPMLTTMLGQLGQSMELVVYPGTVDDKHLIEVLKPGAFDFTLYDRTFHWRTPLPSLLPKKVDRKTHEEFPGNYDFNPYTGDKLIAK
jgi:hypothetical protein